MKAWLRDELGPEARLADAILEGTALLSRLPSLIQRVEDAFPQKGGAPPLLPLPNVELVWQRRRGGVKALGYVAVALVSAIVGAGAMAFFS